MPKQINKFPARFHHPSTREVLRSTAEKRGWSENKTLEWLVLSSEYGKRVAQEMMEQRVAEAQQIALGIEVPK